MTELVELADPKALILDSRREAMVVDFAEGSVVAIAPNAKGEEIELGLPVGMVRTADGGAAIADPTNRRFAVVSPDGAFDRYVRFEECVGIDDLLMREVPVADGQGRWYFEDNPWSASTSIPIVRWEPNTGERKVVGYRNDARGRSVPAVAVALPSLADAGSVIPELFVGDELWTVDRSGRIYRVSPKPYRVASGFTPDEVETGPVIDYERVQVTDEEETALRERLENLPNRARLDSEQADPEVGTSGGFADFRPPTNKPPFLPTAVIGVGPDGLLWVPRVVPIGEPVRCDRFDAHGNPAEPMFFENQDVIVGYGTRAVYLIRSSDSGETAVERRSLAGPTAIA